MFFTSTKLIKIKLNRIKYALIALKSNAISKSKHLNTNSVRRYLIAQLVGKFTP